MNAVILSLKYCLLEQLVRCLSHHVQCTPPRVSGVNATADDPAVNDTADDPAVNDTADDPAVNDNFAKQNRIFNIKHK
jgi:hypothetical protein